jgi:glycosyltransferase involved in cell wall biosynthesis
MKILCLTDDLLGPSVAGSALRAWELARAISNAGHDVRLVGATGSTPIAKSRVEVQARTEIGWAEAIVSPPWCLPPRAFFGDHLVIIDGINPLLAELDAQPETKKIRWRRRTATARLPLVAQRADAVLVGGQAQDAWWSSIVGPEVPRVYVPFGVSDSPPNEAQPIAGVPDDWSVALWWGGVWPWLDLETLVATRKIVGDRKLSLVVPTCVRPGSSSPVFSREDLLNLAAWYELEPPQVVALDHWIEYQERHRILNRCAILAVLHHPGNETDLSFRTRALDGVWARVPLLLSDGGEVSRLVRTNGWGEVVPVHDAQATATAVQRLLDDEHRQRIRTAMSRDAESWSWSRVTAPLLTLLDDPPRPRNRLPLSGGLKAGLAALAPHLWRAR